MIFFLSFVAVAVCTIAGGHLVDAAVVTGAVDFWRGAACHAVAIMMVLFPFTVSEGRKVLDEAARLQLHQDHMIQDAARLRRLMARSAENGRVIPIRPRESRRMVP